MQTRYLLYHIQDLIKLSLLFNTFQWFPLHSPTPACKGPGKQCEGVKQEEWRVQCIGQGWILVLKHTAAKGSISAGRLAKGQLTIISGPNQCDWVQTPNAALKALHNSAPKVLSGLRPAALPTDHKDHNDSLPTGFPSPGCKLLEVKGSSLFPQNLSGTIPGAKQSLRNFY